MPGRAVRHHRGDLPLLLPRGDAPALRQPADQVAAEISHNGCWVRIGGIERVHDWDEIVASCRRDITGAAELQAQVFLASPGAVTPAHFDSYHNVLLQLRGTKEFFVGTFPDERTTRREIARHFDRVHENLRELPTEVQRFELEPGDGIYLPPDTFHWARCGPDVSLAVSCTFSTAASRRRMQIHITNAHLRRLGVDPALPGSSRLRDGMKFGLGRAWRATGRARRWRPFRKDSASTTR